MLQAFNSNYFHMYICCPNTASTYVVWMTSQYKIAECSFMILVLATAAGLCLHIGGLDSELSVYMNMWKHTFYLATKWQMEMHVHR